MPIKRLSSHRGFKKIRNPIYLDDVVLELVNRYREIAAREKTSLDEKFKAMEKIEDLLNLIPDEDDVPRPFLEGPAPPPPPPEVPVDPKAAESANKAAAVFGGKA